MSKKHSAFHIGFATCIGTAIEFYDFYIYSFASIWVLGELFFPIFNPTAQTLSAFLTIGLAFIARPLGAILFGHFGDQKGRKPTLALSLIFMGGATLLIGVLPTYQDWGIWAAISLLILRFCQGLGLGGEWGGAICLANEHAPDQQKHWYGMFPQLGPPLGFILAILSFLLLNQFLTEAEFRHWGWRVPFFMSFFLVLIGLYIRYRLEETPIFQKFKQKTHRFPIKLIISQHLKSLVLGGILMSACYSLFYNATIFCLHYATQTLHLDRSDILGILVLASLVEIAVIIGVGKLSDKTSAFPFLFAGTLATCFLGITFSALLGLGINGIALFLILSLAIMGLLLGPMGTFLVSLFPAEVRYSGSGLSYHLGGILGASFAPALSAWLLAEIGLNGVGGYITFVGLASTLALLKLRQSKT